MECTRSLLPMDGPRKRLAGSEPARWPSPLGVPKCSGPRLLYMQVTPSLHILGHSGTSRGWCCQASDSPESPHRVFQSFVLVTTPPQRTVARGGPCPVPEISSTSSLQGITQDPNRELSEASHPLCGAGFEYANTAQISLKASSFLG